MATSFDAFVSSVEICEIHGDYPTHMHDGSCVRAFAPGCPKCNRVQYANLPEQYREHRFSAYSKDCGWTPTPAHQHCINFAKNLDGNRSFCGNYGAGKTSLAAAIINDINDRGLLARYQTVGSLISEMRAHFDDPTRSEEATIQFFCKPDLLVIDEVGMQTSSKDELLRLEMILVRRADAGRSTLIISNLNLVSSNPKEKTVRALIGERAYDRFRNGKLVRFEWESYRGRGG